MADNFCSVEFAEIDVQQLLQRLTLEYLFDAEIVVLRMRSYTSGLIGGFAARVVSLVNIFCSVSLK